MASYQVKGIYGVDAMGDGTIFRVKGSYWEMDLVIDNGNPDSSVLEVGQNVSFVMNGVPVNEVHTVVGFISDGVIVKQGVNSRYLITNNPNYYASQILYSNQNPFPVCFVAGTLIDTDKGSVPVESLSVGDKVVGSAGLRTVKWVGWRHYHAVSLRTPEQRGTATPVRILAGALGDNQPSQDLRVSPWHHLYIDGVLVRAKDVINGKSIVQEIDLQQFSYYHVELDQFDVIRAHGTYSESWADGGNRDFFQNVDVTTLRPEATKRRLADRPGFTVLRKACEIRVIADKIAARAEALFSEQLSKAA